MSDRYRETCDHDDDHGVDDFYFPYITPQPRFGLKGRKSVLVNRSLSHQYKASHDWKVKGYRKKVKYFFLHINASKNIYLVMFQLFH